MLRSWLRCADGMSPLSSPNPATMLRDADLGALWWRVPCGGLKAQGDEDGISTDYRNKQGNRLRSGAGLRACGPQGPRHDAEPGAISTTRGNGQARKAAHYDFSHGRR